MHWRAEVELLEPILFHVLCKLAETRYASNIELNLRGLG
jgi:hypothetical protein